MSETGRTDYAPDYKSHCGMKFPMFAEFCGKCGVSLEKDRLECEVIEASTAKRIADKTFADKPSMEAWKAGVQANNRFMETVDRLIEFEERENKG